MGTHTIPHPAATDHPILRLRVRDRDGGKETTEDEQLRQFLTEELAKFADIKGPTDRMSHVIRVKTPISIKQCYRPKNPAMQQIIDKEVAKMEKAGIIKPSNSVWSSPVVIVRKKDDRFCLKATNDK